MDKHHHWAGDPAYAATLGGALSNVQSLTFPQQSHQQDTRGDIPRRLTALDQACSRTEKELATLAERLAPVLASAEKVVPIAAADNHERPLMPACELASQLYHLHERIDNLYERALAMVRLLQL